MVANRSVTITLSTSKLVKNLDPVHHLIPVLKRRRSIRDLAIMSGSEQMPQRVVVRGTNKQDQYLLDKAKGELFLCGRLGSFFVWRFVAVL